MVHTLKRIWSTVWDNLDQIWFLNKIKCHLQDVMVSRELPTSNVDVAKIRPGFEHDITSVQKAGFIKTFGRFDFGEGSIIAFK